MNYVFRHFVAGFTFILFPSFSIPLCTDQSINVSEFLWEKYCKQFNKSKGKKLYFIDYKSVLYNFWNNQYVMKSKQGPQKYTIFGFSQHLLPKKHRSRGTACQPVKLTLADTVTATRYTNLYSDWTQKHLTIKFLNRCNIIINDGEW